MIIIKKYVGMVWSYWVGNSENGYENECRSKWKENKIEEDMDRQKI